MITELAWNPHHGAHLMPLGDRIRQLRAEHKWSQGELAERIGGDAAQISRYEHGKMTPGADIVARLAEALDVSCDYLLIDDAPRRSFRTPERHLGEHLAALDELPEEDLASLLNHLDALIAKNRLKTIAGQLA